MIPVALLLSVLRQPQRDCATQVRKARLGYNSSATCPKSIVFCVYDTAVVQYSNYYCV